MEVNLDIETKIDELLCLIDENRDNYVVKKALERTGVNIDGIVYDVDDLIRIFRDKLIKYS